MSFISLYLKSFCGLIIWTISLCSLANEVCHIYAWPESIKTLEKFENQLKSNLLQVEMAKFSKVVGHCYNREPVGKAEKSWLDVKRFERIEKVDQAKNVKKFCESVKKNLIEDVLPNGKTAQDKSPYSQYANCEEGKLVGACLAYHFGYSPKDILLCDSAHDHAWALVRESHDPRSYCLVDRWNSYRCGVKLQGKVEEDIWFGNVKVPGKVIFKFSDATCNTLENSFRYK